MSILILRSSLTKVFVDWLIDSLSELTTLLQSHLIVNSLGLNWSNSNAVMHIAGHFPGSLNLAESENHTVYML